MEEMDPSKSSNESVYSRVYRGKKKKWPGGRLKLTSWSSFLSECRVLARWLADRLVRFLLLLFHPLLRAPIDLPVVELLARGDGARSWREHVRACPSRRDRVIEGEIGRGRLVGLRPQRVVVVQEYRGHHSLSMSRVDARGGERLGLGRDGRGRAHLVGAGDRSGEEWVETGGPKVSERGCCR